MRVSSALIIEVELSERPLLMTGVSQDTTNTGTWCGVWRMFRENIPPQHVTIFF